MKNWYESKTVWIALLQLVIGLLSLVEGALNNPELTFPGVVLIGKSVVDLWVRFKTDTGLRGVV